MSTKIALENVLRDILWNDKGENFAEKANKVIEQVKQLQANYKELSEIVQINCNPPDDCNDPEVLKTYMRACFEKAIAD